MRKKSKKSKLRKLDLIIKRTKKWWVAIIAILTSCGTTKVTVSQPTEGSYTTITVTTNNPITTTPDITTTAELNKE